MSNLTRLRSKMQESGVEALFVTDIINVGWLTGFTGSSGFAIVTQNDAVFLTDSRYTIQAQNEVKDLEIRWYGAPKTFVEFLNEAFEDLQIKDIWFETSVTYAGWKDWTEKHPNQTWHPAPSLITELRKIKTPDEIAKIRAACQLADAAMEHIVPLIQIGRTEYDICMDLEFFIRRNGAQVAFDIIAVGGPNSAKPHGKPGERVVQSGDFFTIDMGAKLDGYNSDITRTFVVGEASDWHKEIYGQVLKAQIATCDALKPGTTGVAVDALAREILNEKDLAQYFGHGLGHGLGRAVHDPGGLSMRSTDNIEAGQVWTIEPGVYIDGKGGVRIEDDVVVTESEPDILTSFPKELMVLR